MKEFVGKDGGRYTYLDDIINLQNLALSFSEIFSECDNFVVSGCNVNGSSISEGYVYINGKIRKFSGSNSVSAYPAYIYEKNNQVNVSYVEGSDKPGRIIYSCMVSTSVPVSVDEITGEVPQFIKITKEYVPRLVDCFFGKYALAKNFPFEKQIVDKNVEFSGNVTFSGGNKVIGSNSITNGSSLFNISYDDNDNLVMLSTAQDGKKSKFVITKDGNFEYYLNDAKYATISNSSVSFQDVKTGNITSGNISISGSDIYNSGNSANSDIAVNRIGYNNGTQFYRNFSIYNGKGGVLAQFNAELNQSIFNAAIKYYGDKKNCITLSSKSKTKTDDSIEQAISFEDSNSEEIACVGFISPDNKDFTIKNAIGNVNIVTDGVFNVIGSITENGTLLSDKYATITSVTQALDNKADKGAVYTKVIADSMFIPFSGGLDSLVSYLQTMGDTDAHKTIRQSIKATSKEECDGLYISKEALLSDIAKDEITKKAICSNIGTMYKDDIQGKMKDTGWSDVCNGNIHIRQIGNIVSIQGTITIGATGKLFDIPQNIDVPTYGVGHVVDVDMDNDHKYNRGIKIDIAPSSREVMITKCTIGGNVNVSFIYMV